MKPYLLILVALSLFSCDWAKEKTKATVHKTGEVVATAGSEFADGVAEGVERTFNNKLELSSSLKASGLKTGKIVINSSDSASDNILSTYLIFDKDFSGKMTAKIYSNDGLEYGRTSISVNSKAGEAKYYDFVFDKSTNIDGKDKVVLE